MFDATGRYRVPMVAANIKCQHQDQTPIALGPLPLQLATGRASTRQQSADEIRPPGQQKPAPATALFISVRKSILRSCEWTGDACLRFRLGPSSAPTRHKESRAWVSRSKSTSMWSETKPIGAITTALPSPPPSTVAASGDYVRFQPGLYTRPAAALIHQSQSAPRPSKTSRCLPQLLVVRRPRAIASGMLSAV